jgi:hypothetical protein
MARSVPGQLTTVLSASRPRPAAAAVPGVSATGSMLAVGAVAVFGEIRQCAAASRRRSRRIRVSRLGGIPTCTVKRRSSAGWLTPSSAATRATGMPRSSAITAAVTAAGDRPSHQRDPGRSGPAAQVGAAVTVRMKTPYDKCCRVAKQLLAMPGQAQPPLAGARSECVPS